MKTRSVRLLVFVSMLLGFAFTLGALRVQGAALLAQHVYAFLLVIAGLAAAASLGFVAWEEGGEHGVRPVAGGLRTFACIFLGAGFAAALGRGITGEDGSGLSFTCLAIGIVVALLSDSVDRRAWLSEAAASR
jgi:hypothetical protein